MTKMKTTKSALISSILALFLCFTMLLGTTFAWFTDSVTSANNIIQSGTLDILLEYYDVEDAEWKDVNDSTDILTGDLWEPGYTDVAYLRIKNNGSLALKYALSVNVVSEKEGTNKAGETFKLSDYIYFDVVEGKEPVFADRVEAMAAVDSETKISKGYAQSASLGANSEFVYLAMVVFMPTDVGNEANHNGENIPEIDLGINIFATQDTVESDSFGTDYDADNAVGSVAEANAMLAENKDVTLMGCDEADGIIVVPADYTGTLTLVNSSIKSVQAEKNVNIVILGNVVVDANGSGVATVADGETAAAFNGSAISADGELNISGSGTLTAIAADTNGAFGIGGMKTQVINIEGVTIERAEGAYAYEIGSDTKYYKDAPEGGAAIGSGYDGAVITLDGVTVINAIGGSKAAGIGARYHVGVTVNITDSAIAYVEGGASAAGIGGSRVSGDLTESGTTINITNSTIAAKGGSYGAGIGSGYDTHCLSVQPMCTINIADSTINAEGGQYAAGVGTGYHNAALSGEIKNSTVTAKSGEKWYKDSYTCAMDVGFGVVDPAREGTQTASKLIYNGVEIGIPAPGRAVSTLADLNKALEDKVDNIILEVDIQTGEAFNIDYEVTINGNGCTISRADGYTGDVLVVVGADASLTLEDVVVDGSGATATGNLIATTGSGSIVLNEGTVLQNNNGAHAVSLATRGGGTLTLNGASIINNSSDSGAIWGGGSIIVNEGSKINNNSSTGSAGAIRMVSGQNLTMNGGEISNNTAAGSGGAIWGYGASTYTFTGGKMNGNTAVAGGAIYTGDSSTVNIGGDFEMCGNTADDAGAMRLSNRTSFIMTGGKISGNTSTNSPDWDGFYGWNPGVNITGGELEDDIYIQGGLTPTVGGSGIIGVVHFDVSTNHNTVNLASDFGTFKFTVAEGSNFAAFNLKPAAGYIYTEGDEAKLVCMNEGYETYWDATTSTFKLQAK